MKECILQGRPGHPGDLSWLCRGAGDRDMAASCLLIFTVLHEALQPVLFLPQLYQLPFFHCQLCSVLRPSIRFPAHGKTAICTSITSTEADARVGESAGAKPGETFARGSSIGFHFTRSRGRHLMLQRVHPQRHMNTSEQCCPCIVCCGLREGNKQP